MSMFSLLFIGAVLAQEFNLIPHNAVEPIKTNVDPNSIFMKFRPHLKVDWGCVPFPAVNPNGDVSHGLRFGGTPWGHCSKSVGQVYARQGHYVHSVNNETIHHHGLMYAWFFPKEGRVLGHRYGWQSIVLWLDNKVEQNPLFLAYSSLDEYKFDKKYAHRGRHPVLAKEYDKLWTDVNTDGGVQPLASWDHLSDQAKHSLNGFKWGKDGFSKRCPFNDNNFQEYLELAWSSDP